MARDLVNPLILVTSWPSKVWPSIYGPEAGTAVLAEDVRAMGKNLGDLIEYVKAHAVFDSTESPIGAFGGNVNPVFLLRGFRVGVSPEVGDKFMVGNMESELGGALAVTGAISSQSTIAGNGNVSSGAEVIAQTNVVATAGEHKYSSARNFQRPIRGTPYSSDDGLGPNWTAYTADGGAWNQSLSSGAGRSLFIPLNCNHGEVLKAITVIVQGGTGHAAVPATLPRLRVLRRILSAASSPPPQTVVGTVNDTVATAGSSNPVQIALYETTHVITLTLSGSGHTIDDGYVYVIELTAESGSDYEPAFVYYGGTISVDVTNLRNG